MTANATSLSVISEGVSSSRVSLHKLQHLVKRALSLVESSEKKDHLYQVAGDIIGAVPDQLTEIERSLDRTLYALSVLGRDSLRSQIPLSDREAVDVIMESVTDPPDKPSPKRVAKRKLNDSDSGMGGAEDLFNPVGRNEVYGLAESGALSNTPAVAVKAVKEMETADVSVAKARSQAKKAPPDVDDIMSMKNSDELATLNRRLVEKVARRACRSQISV